MEVYVLNPIIQSDKKPEIKKEIVKGTIFNMQRFSIHDGPGIRTLVFTKGCPLRCRWCSNPEGLCQKINVLTDHSVCIGCGRCLKICPENAISLIENIGFIIDRNKCTDCLKCAKTCPSKSKVVSGEQKTTDEIIEFVKRDKAFYKHSKGGLTLGGGELLSQPNFSYDLLKKAKDNGINTAIETSGFGNSNDLIKIASVCNTIHYDLKAYYSDIHEKATGVENNLILDNLKKLNYYISGLPHENRPELIIRFPMVKQYNIQNEDLLKRAQFILENVQNYKYVEILPFHNFGEKRYKELDMKYEFVNTENTSIDELKDQITLLQSTGLKLKIPYR